MTNNDNQISDYDIKIMKKNISRLMKNNDITQSQLAEAAGMNQSRVSKILNPETSDCFTIQQLVAIAQALHVSTDSILGIKTEEVQPEKAEITLADVCTKLFELDELSPLSFGTCETGEYKNSEDAFSDPLIFKSPCIYFKNYSITDFIAEWYEIKKMNVQDKALKENLQSTWKSGIIAKNTDKFKKWNFLDKHQYQLKLAGSIIEEIKFSFSGIPVHARKSDLELFKEYIESNKFLQDFDKVNQASLLSYYNKYATE